MPQAGFEPAIPERKQTHALDREATGIGFSLIAFHLLHLQKLSEKKNMLVHELELQLIRSKYCREEL